MRYLVFGDVHGNLLALEAVLAAGQACGAEAYLFVGDLVGYGPQPIECIERLMAMKEAGGFAWVAGNHELAVRGELDTAGYNEEAQKTLQWTGELLKKRPEAMEFLKAAELTLQVNDWIFLTHDSLAEPSVGHYHRETRKARSELACLRYKGGRVCFYGHTHRVRAEIADAEGHIVLPMFEPHFGAGGDPRPIRLHENEIAWIGTGSVGFPGNEQRGAECLIVDDQTWRIEAYAVEYDRQAARALAREILGPVCGEESAEHIARWM
jgi:predicted phosphodiesterase